MKIVSTTPVADLMLAAQDALRDVEAGEVFTVRELFRGFEWKRLPTGVRIQLGSVFFAYAQSNGAALLEVGEKTKQNQQQYVKK